MVSEAKERVHWYTCRKCRRLNIYKRTDRCRRCGGQLVRGKLATVEDVARWSTNMAIK